MKPDNNSKKKPYNKDWAMWKYLKHFRDYSGIQEMTPKDMFYAMNWLIDHNKISRVGSDTSNAQLSHLWDKMMGAYFDSYSIKEKFFELIQRSIDSRNYPDEDEINQILSSNDDELSTSSQTSPEEDMETVSKELLKKDDVFYESKHSNDYECHLFESFKSNHPELFSF